MTDTTARLGLPILAPSQAQKHVTHNEALALLDGITQLVLSGQGTQVPPVAPDPGTVHALGPVPIGEWAGQAGQLAQWTGDYWRFIAPQDGWLAWDLTGAVLLVHGATGWVPALSQFETLGVGTSADAVNRFALASEASLLTHAGAGHQLKINKNSAGDTAALLFQQGFSGRAEIGLVGDDDLVFKVSDDGANFRDGLKLRGQDGLVEVQSLRSGRVAAAADAVVVVPTPTQGGLIAVSLVTATGAETAHGGLFAYDTGSAPDLLTLAAGPGVENRGTQALDVTTGVSGQTNVAAVPGGLQLQNRFNAAAEYSFTFLNGF